MIIHCIGDSHANFFSGFDEMQPEWPSAGIENRLPFFRSYRIGPVLAYKLCEYGTSSRGREKLEQLLSQLEIGSHILFGFGEIDCRAHILLQSENQNRPLEDIISEVVARYLSVIRKTKQAGFRPLIWNVVPSAPTDINQRITVPPQYLFYGSVSERNTVTRIFNRELAAGAETDAIPFLDIFDRLLTPEGDVDRSWYCDEIHLSQKAMPLALEALSRVFPTASFSDPAAADPVSYSAAD